MNKVFLTGEIKEQPKLLNKPEADAHCAFALLVKHRSKKGMREEAYQINAWHKCAEYCVAYLKSGMRVALQGYLTQRDIPIGEKMFRATEVTMSEAFLPSPTSVKDVPEQNNEPE